MQRTKIYKPKHDPLMLVREIRGEHIWMALGVNISPKNINLHYDHPFPQKYDGLAQIAIRQLDRYPIINGWIDEEPGERITTIPLSFRDPQRGFEIAPATQEDMINFTLRWQHYANGQIGMYLLLT